MKKKLYYSFVIDDMTREADISIYGDITSYPWTESDISAYNLSKQLADADVDVINLYINSYGGEVAEGLAIYNALKRHKAKIHTFVDGFACSIASVIFMAGDERTMANASLIMIHNAWTVAAGNAAELRKQAEDLDTITDASKRAYKERINISDVKLKHLMDNETWISPADAVAMGFATDIVSAGENSNAQQSAQNRVSAILQAASRQLAEGEENADSDDVVAENGEGMPEPAEDQEKTAADNYCGFFELIKS